VLLLLLLLLLLLALPMPMLLLTTHIQGLQNNKLLFYE
jgi:hypothetical protein